MNIRYLYIIVMLTHGCAAQSQFGIECFEDYFSDKNKRIGIIANQTSCDSNGRRTVDILKKLGYNVVFLFATEHGFQGTCKASEAVGNTVDVGTGVPVVSIYGKEVSNCRIKQIPKKYMASVDVLLFDLQEAGVRHYTYLDTLLCVLKTAALYDRPVVVCDRPNLLGGRMDGPAGDKGFFSRDSVGSLPLRHGMTIGEIAQYLNEHVLVKKADLKVIPLHDYSRTYNTKPFFKHHLSPNVASPNAVYGYSFLGVLGEVRPFNLGVGTPLAFQLICLPDESLFAHVPWEQLQAILKKYKIDTEQYRYFNDSKKKWFKGVRLAMPHGAQFKSFDLLLDILEFAKNNHINLIPSTYFDTAVGSRSVRRWLSGKCDKQEVLDQAHASRKEFLDTVSRYLLYTPAPYISAIFVEKLPFSSIV